MKETDKHAYKYQSTTWDTCFKSLFSHFKKLGVLYNYPSDFKKDGSFVAYQNEQCSKIAKDWNNFGLLLNCGEVDMDLQAKISTAIDDGCLKPNGVFSDLIHLVMWLVGSLFIMCGGKEQTELKWCNLAFCECLSGKFAGQKLVKVTGMIDKGCHVMVSNPVCRDTDCSLDIVECVKNCNICLVQ